MSSSKERAYYRLSFPIQEQPEFRVGDVAMPVLDVSERGFRYLPKPGHAPEVGDVIQGTIHFRHGVTVDIEGPVNRR